MRSSTRIMQISTLRVMKHSLRLISQHSSYITILHDLAGSQRCWGTTEQLLDGVDCKPEATEQTGDITQCTQ